jgi:hypothetical protein
MKAECLLLFGFFSEYKQTGTEKDAIAVTLYTCIREVLGSNLSTGNDLTWDLRFSLRSFLPTYDAV